MYEFILKNTQSLALPSLLIGIGFSSISTGYPLLSKWLGIISIVLLSLISLYYLISRISNKLVPRRYANSVYVLDDEKNIALIIHPTYKRYQVPGSRLFYNEKPDTAIKRVMQDELGISQTAFKILSEDKSFPKYGNATIVPRPFRVQVEKGKHRLGVTEHYDFLYACYIPGVKPKLNSEFSPNWYTLNDLERITMNNIQQAPWEAIIPAYKHLLENIDNFNSSRVKD